MNQDLATELLNQAGMDVVLANNGQEALDRLAQDARFDGILMDVQMPRMDGLTATRIIKEMELATKRKPTPILGMTANALKEDRERCLAAGMDDYISKPMRLDELSSKIKRLVETSRSIGIEPTSVE